MDIERGSGLASTLTQWAERYGVSRDPYVVRLAQALERGTDLAYWSTTDASELLPPAKSDVVERQLRLSRQLVLWRNVIIFVPLALTWYAIAEATSAFEVFLSQNSTTTANFLEFWQNGYGILPEFWRIGSVARFDVYLILIIIALSLAAGIIHGRAIRVGAVEHELAEHDRLALALEINRYLHDHRDITIHNIDAETADAVRALTTAVAAITKAADELQSTHVLHQDLTPHISELLKGISQLTAVTGSEVATIRATLATAVGELAETVRELNERISSEVIQSGQDVTESARRVNAQILELHRRFSALLDTDR